MRTLLVMRHAKSDWGADHEDDHDRPLAPRGLKAARRMGRFLATVGADPELVLSSSAVRARTTAELVAEVGGWSGPVEVRSALYGAPPEGVLEELAGIADEVQRALVVGHEPTCSALVSMLVSGGSIRLPTGAVACIDLSIASWRDCGPGQGELQWLVTPRMLKTLLD